MKKTTVRQIIVLAAILATFAINTLANTLPLNGLNTGEIADRFAIYFVPAGYVFAIWFVIYAGLIVYSVWQVLPAQAANTRLARVGYLVVLSCVANIVWLFLWHYEVFAWTLPAMVVLLLSLIGLYLGLDIGRAKVPTVERWVVHLPFSVYLGWVTVATIANATQVLFYVGWGGWGINPQVWAVFMLAAATAIAWLMSVARGDVAYLMVITWAFIGVAVEHAATPVVSIGAWVMTALVLAAVVASSLLRRQRQGAK